MDIGYVRVSSDTQNTQRQLQNVQLDRVYADTVSGGDIRRPALARCLAVLKRGDTLHVHSVDRLARNLGDLLALLSGLVERGVGVVFHKENLSFSGESSPFQKLHFHIIGAVAEFERAFIRERQREGIALARREGKYTGRKTRFSQRDVERMALRLNRAERVEKVADDYGVSRQTVYRLTASLRRRRRG